MKGLIGLVFIGISSAAFSQTAAVAQVGSSHILLDCERTRAGCPKGFDKVFLKGLISGSLADKLLEVLPETEGQEWQESSSYVKTTGAAISDGDAFVIVKCQELEARVLRSTCQYFESDSSENLTVISQFKFLSLISKRIL